MEPSTAAKSAPRRAACRIAFQKRSSRGRQAGVAIAMGSRIALLFSIVRVTGLTRPLSKLAGREFVGRELILIIGGFLLAMATPEVHETLEGEEDGATAGTTQSRPSPGCSRRSSC